MEKEETGRRAAHTASHVSRFTFHVSRLTFHVSRLILCLLILLFIVYFSWLAIARHQMFRSSAMDLGYTTQVVWNTLHGRPFEFSTYQNAPIDLPLEKFKRTDNLLGFHVELLLAPISLLYLIFPDPITLLVLQVVVVGLGALPTFWIARKRLESEWAGLAFAAVYLLAPALNGAILSDFHAVTLDVDPLSFRILFPGRTPPVGVPGDDRDRAQRQRGCPAARLHAGIVPPRLAARAEVGSGHGAAGPRLVRHRHARDPAALQRAARLAVPAADGHLRPNHRRDDRECPAPARLDLRLAGAS